MRHVDYSNYVGDNVEIEFRKILSDIAKDTEIEAASLSGNGLTSKQLESLTNFLSYHTKLVDLNLSFNACIVNEGMLSLKKIILEHPKLKSIQLNFNNITDADIKLLLEDNSQELNEQILSINFDFSSNSLTEESLRIAKDKFSPATILSILAGNDINSKKIIEEHQVQALNKINHDTQEETRELPESFETKKTRLTTKLPLTPQLNAKIQQDSILAKKRKAQENLPARGRNFPTSNS